MAPLASATVATTLISTSVRRRPSIASSQRVVRNSAVANAAALLSAKAMPAPIVAGAMAAAPATGPARPATSRASARPSNASGMAANARRTACSAPAAHEISPSISAKVLNASSASATGIRATAEYRHRLWTATSRPIVIARSVGIGMRTVTPAWRSSASTNSAVAHDRTATAVATLAP